MSDSNIYACLVYDGTKFIVPGARMGVPADNQLRGTNREKLCELAGRVCYDSLGKGRGSIGYHEHIQKVGHLSVLEHATFTVAFRAHPDQSPPDPHFFWKLLPALVNQPGIWVETKKVDGTKSLRVTVNFRTVLEWDDWTPHVQCGYELWKFIGYTLKTYAHALAPMIVREPEPFSRDTYRKLFLQTQLVTDNPDVSEPFVADEERWITLFLSGSRGLSHELVRHGDFTAMSQRSTRYVDESESPWVEHPLITAYEAASGERLGINYGVTWADGSQVHSKDVAKITYADTVEVLQPWLQARGVSKVSARKQARGAARGFLGNALYTELIFSANVAQWQRMLRMRASNHADAEIRALFVAALPQLQRSAHGVCFRGFTIEPASDGIGDVVVG